MRRSAEPRGESQPPITAQRRSAAPEGVHPAGSPPIDPGPRRQPGFIHDPRRIQSAGHDLVGRARELAQLDAALSDAIAGRGGVVVVTGEPGIGKTALARAFVEHAGARGASWAWGTCWDGGGAPAYWPWAQLVRELARREDAATLRAALGDGAAWIAGLLPELAGTLGLPAAAAPADLSADQARFRLFDALVGLLAAVAAGRPLVVVLDDLHWADASSVLALEFVARSLPDLPVLAIAAYRLDEAHARQDLATALGGVARASRRLVLEGLDRDDVGRLATARARGLGPGEAAALPPSLVDRRARRERRQPVLRRRARAAARVAGQAARRAAPTARCRCPAACATRSAGAWRRSARRRCGRCAAPL